VARARYLASGEERETVVCFLDFQEIREVPRSMQRPVVDRLVIGHEAQSESLKAFN